MALNFQETAACQSADLRAAEAFEQRRAPVSMCASGGLRADKDQLGRMSWMARGTSQRLTSLAEPGGSDRMTGGTARTFAIVGICAAFVLARAAAEVVLLPRALPKPHAPMKDAARIPPMTD